ncbi:MAG: hypothetical protein PHH13_00730 [Candidatus Peribacteraceae bacterium]|nr:hypothetical protein [Candidatus Peribacteraceae bacterium]
MKKFSLLLGALGGAMAGYLFSNKKLRDELANATDAEMAAKTLGKHLQRDGRTLANQVQKFVESDEVQTHWKTMKGFALRKVRQAKKEVQHYFGEEADAVCRTAGDAMARAKGMATKGEKGMKRAAQKVGRKAAKAAKKVVRGVQANIRKLT